jgi:proline iminopeptidase
VKSILVSGGSLATWSEGKGRPIIFLHGGPGDTHHYMKRMAKPLLNQFQCIFFDQRGTGLSKIRNREPGQFALELMLQDLLSVKSAYSSEPAMLVGHSWGAMYGLFACIDKPEHFERAALLNMGPLDAEVGAKTSDNLLATLSNDEREFWGQLRKRRNSARDTGNFEEVMECDRLMMKLRVKSWIFDHNLHEPFLNDYFQDPPPDREVNKWVWDSLGDWFSWDRVKQATTPIWLCVGESDSVPASQAKQLNDSLPNSTLSIFEKCGHIPWMEHPEKFYSKLRHFLNTDFE